MGESGSGRRALACGPVKLAEPKTDLKKQLESHHLKGAMKQVVDKDEMDAVAEIRSMLRRPARPSAAERHQIPILSGRLNLYIPRDFR